MGLGSALPVTISIGCSFCRDLYIFLSTLRAVVIIGVALLWFTFITFVSRVAAIITRLCILVITVCPFNSFSRAFRCFLVLTVELLVTPALIGTVLRIIFAAFEIIKQPDTNT